jgi:hypothetical protein
MFLPVCCQQSGIVCREWTVNPRTQSRGATYRSPIIRAIHHRQYGYGHTHIVTSMRRPRCPAEAHRRNSPSYPCSLSGALPPSSRRPGEPAAVPRTDRRPREPAAFPPVRPSSRPSQPSCREPSAAPRTGRLPAVRPSSRPSQPSCRELTGGPASPPPSRPCDRRPGRASRHAANRARLPEPAALPPSNRRPSRASRHAATRPRPREPAARPPNRPSSCATGCRPRTRSSAHDTAPVLQAWPDALAAQDRGSARASGSIWSANSAASASRAAKASLTARIATPAG